MYIYAAMENSILENHKWRIKI